MTGKERMRCQWVGILSGWCLIGLVVAAPAYGQVIINEVDSDTPGTDVMEFVELYDGGTGFTPLDGLVVVFYNGSNDLSYASFDLDGFSTNASGFFTLGNAAVPGVSLVFANNLLQNGADAVALYAGNAADFPNNTPVTTVNLIDAVVYDTADPDDAGLLVLLNPGQPQVDEAGGGDSANHSIQRCPDGAGGPRNTAAFLPLVPTPNGPNTNCPEPTGACCDTANLVCADGSTQANCSGPFDQWTAGTLCVDLNPVCSPVPLGACCDDITGDCTEGVEEASCLSSGGRWGGDGSSCVTINPPCVEPTGACCVAGFCGDGRTVDECAGLGGEYQGDNVLCNAVQCPPGAPIIINEIRIDQPGADTDEFFELFGSAGASLDGLTYLVIGDGVGGSGVIEAVVSLNGLFIPADGYFLAVEDTFTLGGAPDLILSGASNGLNFENSDNVTHLLVAGFLGANGNDLDLNDDCVLDSTPWLGELDRIALIREENPPVATECHYGPPVVGPEGTFTPGLALRCPDVTGPFVIGQFDPLGGQDTPGAANNCAVCGNGIVEAGEDCDGGDCCTQSCQFAAAGTQCRAASGLCDVAETCSGASADCPPDELAIAGFECRASAGDCDVAEICDGMNPACPPDAFEPSTLECRPSAGNCDVAEFCTGNDPVCPADLFQPDTLECRPSAGDCDVAEFCTGNDPLCPADGFAPDMTICRPAVDDCDVAEFCTGGDADCPTNGFAAEGTPCSDDGNECTDDVCDGAGACDYPINGLCGACCLSGGECNDEVQAATCLTLGGTFVAAGTNCDSDDDGDGIADPCDLCAGVDDGLFAPECVGAIPTVSEWGLVVLALLLMIVAKLAFARSDRNYLTRCCRS